MTAGRLKIVRVLANPTRRRKPAVKCRKMRKNAKPRARAARSLSGRWIVRIITPARRALYWTGDQWKPRGAKQYETKAAAYNAFKKSGLKRNAWTVADIMPA